MQPTWAATAANPACSRTSLPLIGMKPKTVENALADLRDRRVATRHRRLAAPLAAHMKGKTSGLSQAACAASVVANTAASPLVVAEAKVPFCSWSTPVETTGPEPPV